jgi:hypothetical protein
VVPNHAVYNQSLSFNALGVLVWQLARPEGASLGYRQMLRPGVGQKAILGAFDELWHAGHRYWFNYHQTVNGRPKLFTAVYVFEDPVSLEEAQRHHYTETGTVAILPKRYRPAEPETETVNEVGSTPTDEDASKGTLASLHRAHSSDDRKHGAQTRRSAVVPTTGAGENIGGGAADAENGTQALPSQGAGHQTNDATSTRAPRLHKTPEQLETNRRGIAAVRAAMAQMRDQDAATAPAAGRKRVGRSAPAKRMGGAS